MAQQTKYPEHIEDRKAWDKTLYNTAHRLQEDGIPITSETMHRAVTGYGYKVSIQKINNNLKYAYWLKCEGLQHREGKPSICQYQVVL